MDDDAFEIGDRLIVVVYIFLVLRRICAKHVVDIVGRVLELHVGDREGADVAAGTSKRHPRSRGVLALLIEHFRQPVRQQIGPVRKRAREGGDAIRAEEPDVVADRHAELVAIDSGQGRHDVDRSVRDQRRPVVG